VEDVLEDAPTYINANVHLAVPSTMMSASAMPSSDAFASVFAAKAGVTSTMVQAQATWGAATRRQMSSSAVTIDVHVTVHVKNDGRRLAVEALIRELQTLPVGNTVFEVSEVTVFPAAAFPLVCTPESEAIKSESSTLLQQLVELKQQEVALLRAALTSGAQQCSASALTALANHIGLDLNK